MRYTRIIRGSISERRIKKIAGDDGPSPALPPTP
jgi:hypothetical protein